MYSECAAERIAIIAEGCHLSQDAAQQVYEQAQHIGPDHYSDKVARLRELATLQRVKKHSRVSGKELAGGE